MWVERTPIGHVMSHLFSTFLLCTCQCESPGGPQADQGILTEKVALRIPTYHERSLTESPPKRVVFMPFLNDRIMYVSMRIPWGPPSCPREFWWRKGLFVRIPTLSLAFTVRITSQKIYISTIYIIMISERISIINSPCMVRRTLVICRGGGVTLTSAL